MNEAIIRNLSLTLEDIAESTAKAIAVQQQSLDFLAKVVLDNKIVLGYLLDEQGGVWVVANITCCTWINTSGEAETQLHKITEQATCSTSQWLQWGLSLTYLILTGLGITLFINNHSNLPGVPHPLKSFKSMFTASTKQANDLPKTRMSEKERRV